MFLSLGLYDINLFCSDKNIQALLSFLLENNPNLTSPKIKNKYV